MKRLLIFIASVVAIVAALDIAAGAMMRRYVASNRLPGDCAAIDFTVKEADADVIILGNSIALNSMMPSVMADTLGMSVYNGASNDQQLIFFYTMMDCILQRHTPRAFVVALRNNLFNNEGNGDRYNLLAPYYGMGYSVIDSTLESASAAEPLLLQSTFYRYNTVWWRILLYALSGAPTTPGDGFVAKGIPPHPPVKIATAGESLSRSENFALLERIIGRARAAGSGIIFVKPPQFVDYTTPSAVSDTLAAICRRHGVALIDDTSDPQFMASPGLFFDAGHLNADGALIYSSRLASRLKPFLK